jgi:hypothetical protein
MLSIISTYYFDTDFQNTVMDLIIKSYKFHHEQFDCIPGTWPEDICRVYGNTPTDSPLRISLLDVVNATTIPDFYDDFRDPEYQPSILYLEYLADLYNRIRTEVEVCGRYFKAPWERNHCYYHYHPRKPSGYSCKE